MYSVFVSGQVADKQAVQEAYALIKAAGFRITHDWTADPPLGDPRRNAVQSAQRSRRDISGVVASDLYVLLTGNSDVGKGMYAELGAALALHELRGSPQVYVVGPMNHMSIFYLHPAVRHRDTVQQVLEDLQEWSGFNAA